MLRNKVSKSEGTDIVSPLPSYNKKQDHWYLLLKSKKNTQTGISKL